MVKLPGQVDNLGVDDGVAFADGFTAELMVLAQPAGLRPVVTENRGKVIKLYRLRQVSHTVLDESAADRSGAFRTERQAFAAFIIESVHLLINDVRPFPDAAGKKGRLFESGNVDALEAV